MLTPTSDSTAKTHSNPAIELEFLLPLRCESLYTLPWQPLLILQEGRAGAVYGERVDKADIAKAKVEEGIAALAAALEAGNSDALTAYMTTMSRFPRYSFGNTILIAFQRPDATHVAGFNAWKSLGRSVMKGEKGIMILAPMVGRREKDEEPRDESQTSIPDKDSDLPAGTKCLFNLNIPLFVEVFCVA